MPEWKTRYPGVETLNVAVMGCIVNGPGECKHADIGISLPGTGETPTAPVFIDGKKAATLRGATVARRLQADGDRLYRAALRPRGADRGGINQHDFNFGSHPEEPRVTRRLEGWATHLLDLMVRDAPLVRRSSP